jgi:hypothetical protein
VSGTNCHLCVRPLINNLRHLLCPCNPHCPCIVRVLRRESAPYRAIARRCLHSGGGTTAPERRHCAARGRVHILKFLPTAEAVAIKEDDLFAMIESPRRERRRARPHGPAQSRKDSTNRRGSRWKSLFVLQGAMKRPMREYMRDYRDKGEPKRVWRRIVIKFLGPRKSWRVSSLAGTANSPLSRSLTGPGH